MGVPGALVKFWNKAKNTVQKIGGAFRKGINFVRDNAGRLINTVQAAGQTGANIANALGQVGGKFGDTVNKLGQVWQNGTQKVAQGIGIARDVANAVGT